ALASLGLALLPPRTAARILSPLVSVLRVILGKGWALALAIGGLWACAIVLGCSIIHVDLAHSAWLHVVGAATILWVSLGCILIVRTDTARRARALAACMISLVFLSVSLVILEIALRINIGALPTALVSNLPQRGQAFFPFYDYDDEITVGYRYKPGVRLSQKLRSSDATLYSTQADLIRPVRPDEDRILSEASFTTDENGYRNESPLHPHYPVAVSGDSFTSYSVEPRPWPKSLSEKLAAPVLNLGLQGYGPQAAAEALIKFGLPRKPRWLLLTWYEGNDLFDAQDYEKKRRSGLGWREHAFKDLAILERYLVCHAIRHGMDRLRSRKRSGSTSPREYPYPFTVELGGRNVELCFTPTYFSTLSIPEESVKSLACIPAFLGSFQHLQRSAEKAGARLIVVYIPTKEHCYAPLLPRDLLETKLGGARRPHVSPQGDLLSASTSPELLRAADFLENMDGQRKALAGILAREGIDLLDLTAEFQEAAGRGEQLYWSTDNHWAPAGHELAASILARRLRQEGWTTGSGKGE
ncbi:MAG TPA: hypothetical protein VMT52_19500, partial [Planctomycetota bacterium]|nr:hypothetical protein [Planctomycetota bacterium]